MAAVVLGIGCDRGTSQETLATAVAQCLTRAGLDYGAVRALATIDKKCDEPGLLALAEHLGVSLTFYTAEVLARVPVPNPSATVMKHMGTPAVAEAAALLAAHAEPRDLIIEKHKYRGADGKHATVSVARMNHESR